MLEEYIIPSIIASLRKRPSLIINRFPENNVSVIPFIKKIKEKDRNAFCDKYIRIVSDNGYSKIKEELSKLNVNHNIISSNVYDNIDSSLPVISVCKPPNIPKELITNTSIYKLFKDEDNMVDFMLGLDILNNVNELIYVIPSDFFRDKKKYRYIRTMLLDLYHIRSLTLFNNFDNENIILLKAYKKAYVKKEDQVVDLEIIYSEYDSEKLRITLNAKESYYFLSDFENYMNKITGNNDIVIDFGMKKYHNGTNKMVLEFVTPYTKTVSIRDAYVSNSTFKLLSKNNLYLNSIDIKNKDIGIYLLDGIDGVVSKHYYPTKIQLLSNIPVKYQEIYSMWFNKVLKFLRKQYNDIFLINYEDCSNRREISYDIVRYINKKCKVYLFNNSDYRNVIYNGSGKQILEYEEKDNLLTFIKK